MPLVVFVGVGVGLLVAPGAPLSRGSPASSRAAPASDAQSRLQAALPAPAKGFEIPRAHQLGGGANITKWAPVLRATDAHQRPSWSSPMVVPVSTRTPEGTANLVTVNGEVVREGPTGSTPAWLSSPTGEPVGYRARRWAGGPSWTREWSSIARI